MRFVVLGAGAIGGVIGAGLHRAGHEVVLVARGRTLDALRSNGLRVQTRTRISCCRSRRSDHPPRRA
jgi:2-dehydropantoate 2-reductase